LKSLAVLKIVMAGFVPATHSLDFEDSVQKTAAMGRRDKPGDDG